MKKVKARSLIVTATDTNIGKTIITAALALGFKKRGLKVKVIKPVQSGHNIEDVESDGKSLRYLAQLGEQIEDIVYHSFEQPVAPLIAARMTNQEISKSMIFRRLRDEAESDDNDLLLIEGVGGFLAPIGDNWSIADVAHELGSSFLIVASAYLGTVNHTLMTIEAILNRGLPIAGVVLNKSKIIEDDLSIPYNLDLIDDLSGDISCLGIFDYVAGGMTSAKLLQRLESDINFDLLISNLGIELGVKDEQSCLA